MKPLGIVIHNSASSFGDAAQINAWHKERGWAMIGYHAVILNGVRYGTKEKRTYIQAEDGLIEGGRAEDRVGAHCLAGGMNAVALGVCCIGMPGQIVAAAAQADAALRQRSEWAYLTARQHTALILWLVANCRQYGLDPAGTFRHPETRRVIPVITQHSDHDPVNKPSCAALNMGYIRQAVSNLMSTTVPASPSVHPAPVGTPAPAGWKIIGPDGKTLREGVPAGTEGTGLVRLAVEAVGGSVVPVDERKEVHIFGPTPKVVR
jgi:hypothetical protein